MMCIHKWLFQHQILRKTLNKNPAKLFAIRQRGPSSPRSITPISRNRTFFENRLFGRSDRSMARSTSGFCWSWCLGGSKKHWAGWNWRFWTWKFLPQKFSEKNNSHGDERNLRRFNNFNLWVPTTFATLKKKRFKKQETLHFQQLVCRHKKLLPTFSPR